MPIRLKQIFAGCMIAGDIFLMFVAIALSVESSTTEIGIFMIIFLIVDAYLSVDYIKSLHRQEIAMQNQEVEEHVARIKQQAKEEKLEDQRDAVDDALADELRRQKDPSPEELKEMLSQDHLDQPIEQKK